MALSLETILLSGSMVFLLRTFQINTVRQYVTFYAWLVSLSMVFSSTIRVVGSVGAS